MEALFSKPKEIVTKILNKIAPHIKMWNIKKLNVNKQVYNRRVNLL